MRRFKRGEIVVVANHKDVARCWFKRMPINLITTIIKTFSQNLKGESVVIRILDCTDYTEIYTSPDILRSATQREQFLYHIFGMHVLGEEDEV